ncbi:dUTPase [Bacillus phage BSP12]|nr:dUTPase [Bacillus phage BSP12]
MEKLNVFYKLEKGAVKPTQGYEDDFAYDLYAAEGRLVPPLTFRSVIVPTNLKTAFDPTKAGMKISLRSGAAVKTPLVISNSPGIVEGTYRGGIGILVRNSFIDNSLVDFVMTVEGKKLPLKDVPSEVLQNAKEFYEKETEMLGYASPSEELQKAIYSSVVPRGTVYIAEQDRIAQASFSPKLPVRFLGRSELPDSVRGENKFGSSGAAAELIAKIAPPEPIDEEVSKAMVENLKRVVENSRKRSE